MSGRTLSPIRVAPGGRYFETLDGEPFLFIGANDAVSWPGLAGLYRRRNLEEVERYLTELADSGVTVLRLMLEYCHRDGRYFERPVGTFNPAMIRLWDDLFRLCEQVGLRVLLAPWDNFWMAMRWHKHPYNTANGGPAVGPGSFFTDDAVIAAAIRRLRFVVERWGGSGVLAAWDLFNEIHPYWGGTAAQQSGVIARLSDAVREAEMKTWGFTRPQTLSHFGPDPDAGYTEMIFRHPSLDFATTHIYYKGPIDYPRNTVTSAVTMGRWVRHALKQIPPNRPFTDTEHGPIHLFNDHRNMLDEAFDDEYERHLMWAHLASGGAGSGMRWPARHPHVITAGMRRALASLARFTRLMDWRHFTPQDAAADVNVKLRKVQVFACRDAHQAVVWLLRGNTERNAPGLLTGYAPQNNVPLTLRGLAPGKYFVHYWDTRRGCLLDSRQVTIISRTGLNITLPTLNNDLAIAVRGVETIR